MKKLFLLLLIFSFTHSIMKAQTVIPLYDGKVPNSKPATDAEKSEMGKDGILRISKVSIPTLTVYKPAHPSAKGTAVIICPGGGYSILAAGHEGSDVAKLFNEWGITAFVLKYRLPDDAIMVNKEIGPLQDAQRAIQLVRTHAKEWSIDASKIGIMGFSAGGHLAATASTHFDKPVIDEVNGISLRPDFSMLIYPVISFSDEIGHIGSRNNLLGKNASADKINEYSNELQVTSKTPPAFLVHASDDGGVNPANSVRYYEALLKNKIPAELHIYQRGGHGFGMNNKTTSDKWMERLKNWLVSNGNL